MEFNKSLFMPVCIMVKILKSELDSTDRGLLFDLLGISHVFAHCSGPGTRKPSLRQRQQEAEGGRGGRSWEGGRGSLSCMFSLFV